PGFTAAGAAGRARRGRGPPRAAAGPLPPRGAGRLLREVPVRRELVRGGLPGIRPAHPMAHPRRIPARLLGPYLLHLSVRLVAGVIARLRDGVRRARPAVARGRREAGGRSL